VKCFACVFATDGLGVPSRIRRSVESWAIRRGLPFVWTEFTDAAVIACGDDAMDSSTIAVGNESGVIVGTVRLDNRPEIEQLLGVRCDTLSDLAVVLQLFQRRGASHIGKLLGDFAFAIWDPRCRRAVASCDAFAVRRLYYTQSDGLVLFGSRAELIAPTDSYEMEFLADLVSTNLLDRHLTVYSGVKCLPAASIASVDGHGMTADRYWSAADFEPDSSTIDEAEAVARCRELLIASVRLRLDNAGPTWAQLSGGLDSSTVVGLIEWLSEQGIDDRGLAGAVTIVDGAHTAADERAFSAAVLERWPVRSEELVDTPMWYDENQPVPPQPDQPSIGFEFYPRDRRLIAVVRQAGGRVLLTGWGGDQLFSGNMLYFADRIACGELFPALVEMLHIAAQGRMSFWAFAYENALLPFLWSGLQRRITSKKYSFPSWMNRKTLRRCGIKRQVADPFYRGRVGHKYFDAVVSEIGRLERVADQGVLGDELDLRHPFLYRPLVEFALRLPPRMCARPLARRWVLRQAMRGILPEVVRMRLGKGGPTDVLDRTFVRHRALLESLVRDPILAQLNIVEADRLRGALRQVTNEQPHSERLNADLLNTLGVEAWLQLRSGRWPHGAVRQQRISRDLRSPVHAGSQVEVQ
jgi:asparagine synthase (glutamine-hydrolysing)